MNEIKLKELKKRDFFSQENNFKKFEKVKSELIYGDESKDKAFISIVIPTFRREKLLAETIQSILNQENFEDYEIVVVDNDPIFGVITETEKVIRSFNSNKILYYRNRENLEMYGNWNRCIELARSKWVCMVHDDDALVKNHLVTMTNIIKKNSKISYLACRHNNIDEREKGYCNINKYSQSIRLNKKYVRFNNYKDYNFGFKEFLLGAVFDREKAIKIGGFKPKESYCEDYFFVSRFAYYYNVYSFNEKLYLYRWAYNQSLKTEMWEDELVYEYYLYKYISQKRNFIIRPFYKLLSKYYIIRRMNRYINGTSVLRTKCNINKENVYRMCGFNDGKVNSVVLGICELIKKFDLVLRRVYGILVKNIRIGIDG